MTDRYDQEVKRLTEHPELIYDYWIDAKPLFRFCCSGPSANTEYGCPSMVRGGKWIAETPELTAAIRADDRLPVDGDAKITVDQLPVFAEWQRRIDKELGRIPPVMVEEHK